MAKSEKQEAPVFVTISYPDPLPKGVVTENAKRTFAEGSGDDRVSETAVKPFVLPAEDNAEGVRNYIGLLSEVAKAAGAKGADGNPIEDYGVRFAAGAIRKAVVSELSAQLGPSTMGATTSALPSIPNVRTVDLAEAGAAAVAARNKELALQGKKMSAQEMAEIFASFVGA